MFDNQSIVYEFDPSVPDVRCKNCKHHRFIIHTFFSSTHFIHTDLDFPHRNRYLAAGLHVWAGSDTLAGFSDCLKSYKEV